MGAPKEQCCSCRSNGKRRETLIRSSVSSRYRYRNVEQQKHRWNFYPVSLKPCDISQVTVNDSRQRGMTECVREELSWRNTFSLQVRRFPIAASSCVMLRLEPWATLETYNVVFFPLRKLQSNLINKTGTVKMQTHMHARTHAHTHTHKDHNSADDFMLTQSLRAEGLK